MSEIRSVVIKVGTRLLTSADNSLDESSIGKLVDEICSIRKKGVKVSLVTSGAIAAGMSVLGYKRRPTAMPELQAAAAVGQNRLMQVYGKLFGKNGAQIAQILLTREDLNDRVRYLNAKNTIKTLLEKGIIPVINENDTVSTEEIKFGDNDILSALVANLAEADRLIILTTVKGLYDDKDCLVSSVLEITPEVKRWAKGTTSEVSRGGMATKILAAEAATSAGISCCIADGKKCGILESIVTRSDAHEYTEFKARAKKLAAKKSWIKFASRSCGKIIVDDGARAALTQKNKSLLASGIIGAEGSFGAGATVKIVDSKHHEFGIGVVNYSSAEIEKIKGKKTLDIEKALGYKESDEVVHKDNLVIL